MITADYGKKYNREVLAVPDNIYNNESIGSNKLIYEGAKIYLREEQLLIDDRYKLKPKTARCIYTDNILHNLDETEKRIISTLSIDGSKSIEELCFLINIDKMELVEKLSIMELEDKVIIQGTMVDVEK